MGRAGELAVAVASAAFAVAGAVAVVFAFIAFDFRVPFRSGLGEGRNP